MNTASSTSCLSVLVHSISSQHSADADCDFDTKNREIGPLLNIYFERYYDVPFSFQTVSAV